MKRWFLAALLCFGFLVYWLVTKKYKPDPPPAAVVVDENLEFYKSIRPGCPSEIRQLKMDDPYLRGILELGASYQAAMNFYLCNPAEKGDLVLYRYSWKFLPVARQVVAVGGDRLRLKKLSNGWELWINDKVHVTNKQKFLFGVPESPPPLENYIQANQGKVLPNHVVILASFPPGEKDSSVFGVVEINDIIAKITH